MGLRVVDGLLAGADVPHAPRGDHVEVGREGLVGQLEAHLVVALAGAAVGDGVRAFLQGDLHLVLGLQGPGDGGAQQVLALVDGARAQQGEQEVLRELVAQVEEVELGGARGHRLLLEARQVLVLPHVRADADDLGSLVVLLEPGDDDGGVQSPRVREDDLLHALPRRGFLQPVSFAHSSASSMMVMPLSISLFVMTSGGASRTTFAPERSASRPPAWSFARSSFMGSAASSRQPRGPMHRKVLEPLQKPLAAQIPDRGEPVFQPLETGAQVLPLLLDLGREAGPGNDLPHLQRDGRGDRASSEGRAMIPHVQQVVDLLRDQGCREGQPACQRLGEGDDVGLKPDRLGRVEGPRPRQAGLHFIGDEDGVVLPAALVQGAGECG